MAQAPIVALHVVAGLPRDGGGLSELVPGLCGGLVAAGCAVRLATLEGAMAAAVDVARQAGVEIRAFPTTGRQAALFSRALDRGLRDWTLTADVVHVHSNWTFPVWCACRAALRRHKPLVMSPQGCLAPERLARSRWKKQLVGLFFDRRYLRRAACLHATAPAERGDLRARGLRNPVAVIGNAVNTAAFAGAGSAAAFRARFPACEGRRLLLYLSRVDPLKGLDLLAAAWCRLAPRFSRWHLAIAGPDERGCTARVSAAVRAGGVAGRTTFCGPLYGQDRLDAYCAADLFVLPSRHENFGIAVAEAAFLGKPVVTTQGTPWSGLAERNAGWWVPATAAGIEAALADALARDDDALRAMGARGREWVAATFTWATAARQMLDVYAWILGRGTRPACVSVDPEAENI